MLKFWRRKKEESTAFSITYYQMLVHQVRQKWFYQELGIADTPTGRFEVMTLHLFLLLRRLKQEKTPMATQIAQEISDLLVIDLDESLRDLRISETKVAKQFNKYIQGFYGRLIAYDKALEEDEAQLKVAIHRNLYDQEPHKEKQINTILGYIHEQAGFLQTQDITLLKFKGI